VHPYCSV